MVVKKKERGVLIPGVMWYVSFNKKGSTYQGTIFPISEGDYVVSFFVNNPLGYGFDEIQNHDITIGARELEEGVHLKTD
jgi:hypothetical protein